MPGSLGRRSAKVSLRTSMRMGRYLRRNHQAPSLLASIDSSTSLRDGPQSEAAIDLLVQPIDDFGRDIPRHADAAKTVGLIPKHEVSYRWNFR